MNNNKINIGIVEDDYHLSESVSIYLQKTNKFDVRFNIKTFSDLHLNTEPYSVDVILLDLHLKDGLCVHSIFNIHRLFPFCKILILTGDDDDEMLINSIENGANGFILKPLEMSTLIQAINMVYEEGYYLSDSHTALLMKLLKRRKLDSLSKINRTLTIKQRKVLTMLRNGKTDLEIAKELNITLNSVELHKRNINRKYSVISENEIGHLFEL